MTIELSQDDFELLLVMLGYGTGAAMQHDQKLAYKFLALANRINKDNPNWTPYAVSPEGDSTL
jgi:hypothetical protein